MKIGSKILCGFVVVVLIAAIIGYTGYSSMSTVVDRVDKADDANRLVKDVLKARQQEKNFQLRGYDLQGSDTEHSIQKLNTVVEGAHAQIAQTKAKFNSVDNIAQMDALSEELDKYEASIAEFEDIYDEQEDAKMIMVEKARIVEAECDALRISQKEQLDADLASGKSTAELTDRIGKADDANRLIKYAESTRVAEKNYMLRKEEKYAAEWRSLVDDIDSQCRTTRAKFNQQVNLDQIDTITKALGEYETAGEEYISLYHEQLAEEENVVAAAREFENIANEIRADQKDEMLSAQSSANTMIVGFTIVAVILSVLIALFIAKLITKPIDRLVRELRGLEETVELDRRATVDSKDEIGMLGNSLNSMLDNVAGPAQKLTEIAKTIAKGDLTKDINIDAKGDILVLTDAMKTMLGNLRSLISNITKNANIAASSAEELSASSEQVNASSQQVSSTIQEVAKGGQDLSRLSGETKSSIEEVGNATKMVADNSQKTAENASNAQKTAVDGLGAGKRAGESMTQIMETAEKTSGNIAALDTKSQEIGKIIDVINNISEQTNLLALNAAIEAARAGEAGRGFAVVADEVRKLAEESQKATTQIADLITAVQEETKTSVSGMDSTKKAVDKGSAVINEAVQSLENISELVKGIAGQVQEVSAAAQESQAGVEKVSKSAAEVSAIAEESAAASEEVSASMEETTASMTQVSEAAQSLAQGAEDLKKIVSEFKLDDSSVEDTVREDKKIEHKKESVKKGDKPDGNKKKGKEEVKK